MEIIRVRIIFLEDFYLEFSFYNLPIPVYELILLQNHI